MRVLFIGLILALYASDVFQLGMSLGPGLSVKNALLYPIALGLIFRMALSGRYRMRLPIINMAFILWVTYAALTWVACFTVLHYPGYNPLRMGIELKSVLIDSALFFFIFLYGSEGERDFLLLARTLAACMGIANVLTLADLAGIVHLGITVGSAGVEAGRVFGAFGNANDSGALIVCMLPLMIAVATSSRGAARIFWYGGALASVAVLVLTVSRSAYVGLLVGYAAAVWFCRRQLPTSKVMAWALIGLTCVIIAGALAAALMPGLAQLFGERLFSQSMAMSMSTASSGRTTVWADALSAMMSHPLTLLTGFGWDVYNTMFVLVTHNYYLDQYFGLGLVGLFSFLTIEYQTISTGLRAIAAEAGEMRPYMIAFVFGMLGLSVCLFFDNLDKPWCYVWVYVGLTMRAAADIIEKEEKGARRPAPGSMRLKHALGPTRIGTNAARAARHPRAAIGGRR